MDSTPQYVLSTDETEIVAEMTIEDVLVDELVGALYWTEEPYLSVAQWQLEKRAKHSIDMESWLLYAAGQLDMMGMRVEFSMIDRNREVFNDVFDDVLVYLPDAVEREFEAHDAHIKQAKVSPKTCSRRLTSGRE